MKSFGLLAAALLLASGLASPTGNTQEPSDPDTSHVVAIRDGNEWELPKEGNPSPKQMENLVNNYERLGLCLSWEGSTDWDPRRTTGLCRKYCDKNPGPRKGRGGRGRRETMPTIESREIDRDEALKKMGGVSCILMQEANRKPVYKPDENGHRWATGVCECDVPQIAKEITLFVAEGFAKVGEAIKEGLQQLCAFGFAALKGIVDVGISFIPGVGVYVKGVQITAKMVKAAKTAYQNNISGSDFFSDKIKDVCGVPPPFDFSLEGVFMALVDLPDSALVDDALIGCQLKKTETCKKLEKVSDPKKEKIIYPGKNKKQQEQDLQKKKKEAEEKKKKEAEEKKRKEAEEKKRKEAEEKKRKEAEEKKKKEAEDKKNKDKKKQTGACNIGAICNGQH